MRNNWVRRWFALVLAIALSWTFNSFSQTTSSESHLTGRGIQFGWQIELNGAQGTFVADGEQWDLEYYQQTPGLGGYLQVLGYMGRKIDNFIQVYVFANHVGNSFFVNYYNYKSNAFRVDQFRGEYQLQPLEANPTVFDGYVPSGGVPGYTGQDFTVASAYAQIGPVQGRIAHPQLSIDRVYPVQNIVVSSSWSEFWMIGLDAQESRAYFLIFYSVSDTAWVVDLANGAVAALPLGQATVFPEKNVQIKRNVVLKPTQAS